MAEEKKEPEDHQLAVHNGPGGDIEAGEVVGVGATDLPSRPTHKDITARKLAFGFMWIFAVGSLVHYGSTLYVVRSEAEAAKSLAEIYHLWLPVVATFVSATATYYFAKSK
jgi:L-ascorbate metabolism protein UlaG (beta-lactamase superfamily)